MSESLGHVHSYFVKLQSLILGQFLSAVVPCNIFVQARNKTVHHDRRSTIQGCYLIESDCYAVLTFFIFEKIAEVYFSRSWNKGNN